MNISRLVPTSLLAVSLLIGLPSWGRAQEGPAGLLGLVPDQVVMAGQAHVRELLDYDRLEVLMRSLGAVLGTQADSLIEQMQQEYRQSLATFANNVEHCVVYAESFENNAPVTVCRGNFGSSGWTPPALTHVETVGEQYLVTGSRRQPALAALATGAAGTATLGGVAIDPSALAHFIVVLSPELTESISSPVPVQSIRMVQLRILEDPAELAGLSMEVRLSTGSPESAQQINATIMALLANISQNETEVDSIGLSADEVRSWVTLDGNEVIFKPRTEGLAIMTAVAIPAFFHYIERTQQTESRHFELPANLPQAPPPATGEGTGAQRP